VVKFKQCKYGGKIEKLFSHRVVKNGGELNPAIFGLLKISKSGIKVENNDGINVQKHQTRIE
jgi:hypothetical protein